MMKLPNSEALAATLTDRVGVALAAKASSSPDGPYVDLRPHDLPVNEGFFVRTTLGWRHIRAEFNGENFAADLLRHMATADPEQHARFVALSHLLSDRGGRMSMNVNGAPADPSAPQGWPAQWNSLHLAVERTPVMIDHEDVTSLNGMVAFWGGNLLAMAVSLLPVEEIEPLEPLDTKGLPEGARERIEVNRYERNRINRSLCIAIRGTTCLVCNFDFLSGYGETGRDFIHIHHVVPVSKLGAGYVIDPAKDLVPVCPNCHAMLHRRDPPFDVEELIALMRH